MYQGQALQLRLAAWWRPGASRSGGVGASQILSRDQVTDDDEQNPVVIFSKNHHKCCIPVCQSDLIRSEYQDMDVDLVWVLVAGD